MPITRRDLGAAALGALLANETLRASPARSETTQSHGHDMPAHWQGTEKIAFLIYPQFTALDMVGPHHMLASLMGATVHLVAKSPSGVERSETNIHADRYIRHLPGRSRHHLRAGRVGRNTGRDAG